MGFGVSIYKVKNNGNNFCFNQYQAINRYFEYEVSNWAKENFPTAEEYAKIMIGNTDKNCELPSENIIETFRPDYRKNKYSSSIFTTVESWCSDGRYFWDDIEYEMENELTNVKEGSCIYKLSESLIKKLLVYANDFFKEDKNHLINVKVDHAYITEVIDSDSDSDSVDSEQSQNYHSFHCDGIEVTYYDGSIRRIDSNDIELSTVFVPFGNYCDTEKMRVVNQFRNALIDILTTVDFNTEDVFIVAG